ncbi:Oxidation resistance protein 1 [Seminavis robusta]|uniref:Oxidation resistance protein 1 n=1 Tax=Seminavis robusta TaxID=568900 RepID=A0A9N8HRR1_9STRA|nr:Oxidation resistance protein 1 [Seminavis robusta]|eukprot:Sro1608_g285660.1 Oxidation resistance protein 1 (606) ;mRNA; f:6306-8212
MAMIHEEKKIGDEEKEQHLDSHAHHTGILRGVLERAVANRFSSKPIDVEKNQLTQDAQEQQKRILDTRQSILAEDQQQLQELTILEAVEEDNRVSNSIRDVASDESNRNQDQHRHHCPTLTPSEQKYLEGLLESEDPESIRRATLILSDLSLFPREESLEDSQELKTTMSRRDSKVQRLFFRMHEMGRTPTSARGAAGHFTSSPIRGGSTVNTKRRMCWNERRESSIVVLESQTSMSSLLDDTRRNSLIASGSYQPSAGMIRDDTENDDILATDDDYPQVTADRSGSSTTSQDISSWLDGAGAANGGGKEGPAVEVHNVNGIMGSDKIVNTAESLFKTSFAILGTAADDVSCIPHVLSPPLMESLLEFVPETLSDYHFWIKYSLVRDGANLYTLLRHVRASTRSILAIETTDGQVFGAFTSKPWRLLESKELPRTGEDEVANEAAPKGEDSFFGSQDTFLWKMRQSRFESQALVRSATVEQAILMESELAVYPFTGANNFVQHCTPSDGIGLGDNASAIRLDPSLRTGSTAASETFGNPCLLDPKEETSRSFEVANLEVWTLTPHDTVKEAEQTELKAFFQQRQREEHRNRLDLFGILVGGPKMK